MDLIYADDSFRDMGVFQNYSLDMAYGIDENDFEIKMPISKPKCSNGWFIYMENTEYGGVIDAIGADTKEELLSYHGRTWHGILASRVIEPENGLSHYTVTGEANTVISELITLCGLTSIFDVESEDSGIIIDTFDFRYDDLNTGIFCMLQAYDAKLIIRVHDGKAFLHAVPLVNYATDEFDSSQMKFSLKQTFSHVNHLICLGQGQQENRYVIHLFTNGYYSENSDGLQPYALVENPIKDSEYILDKSQQLITGKDEYTAVYDYPDAATTENYETLLAKPSDWDDHYDRYYEKPEDEEEQIDEDSGDNYTQLERRIEDVYELTQSQPADWTTNFTDYYKIDSGGEYVQVEADSDTFYDQLSSKPADWKEHYDNYYRKVDGKYKKVEKVPVYTEVTRRPTDWTKNDYKNYYTTDGAGNWHSVSGDSRTIYKKQTQEPSDWSINWKDYYVQYKRSDGSIRFHKLEDDDYYGRLSHAPKWKKNTFYVQGSKTIAPKFDGTITYYAKKMVIPTFNSGTAHYTGPYFARNKNQYKTWQAGTYYRLDKDVDMGIVFIPGQYYALRYDHYAELIAGGLDRLSELNNSDELTIDIVRRNSTDDISGSISLEDTGQIYDIGDIVGGQEEITGVFTAQPITKKIINIDHDVVYIQYEVR